MAKQKTKTNSIVMHWGERKESLEICMDKLAMSFNFLSDIDYSFVDWFPAKNIKLQDVLIPLDLDEDGIVNLLKEGKINKETHKTDSGYLVFLKSFIDYQISHVLCVHFNSYNKAFANSFSLKFSILKHLNYLTRTDSLYSIYTGISKIWLPKYGFIIYEGQRLLEEEY